MSSSCTILFDQNEHGTYFTGQTVTGRVILNINKSKKLKGIKLQISGYAACQWREGHGKPRPNHQTKGKMKHIYHGREDYIASTTFLAGSEDGQQFFIEAGTHTYTFSCPIPINCPSSFEGTFGHIRYLAKVVSMKTGSSNRTHTVGFTVLKLLDLNKESRLLKAPCNNEALENFCFLNTKAVHLKVDVMQSGYVPGQFMLVSVNVNNESSVNCQKLLICLNLRATYTSDIPCMRTTSEKICLVKKALGPCPRHESKQYAESIRIPATPPTCEHLSKVVRVSYEVCVIAVMNSLMRNPKTTIPITIGNVPLTNSATPGTEDLPTTSTCAMQIAGHGEHNLLSEQIESFEIIDGEDDDDDDDDDDDQTTANGPMEMPPPTYEEAMFMTRNIGDDDVNTVGERVSFTPRYPVYDVDSIHAITPAPNPPQKRRRRKRKKAPVAGAEVKEKPPVESPVQI